MIAHEHLHFVSKRQMLVIGLGALCAAALMYLGSMFLSQASAFFLSVALLVGISGFITLLIQKSGALVLFYGIAALLTASLSDIGVLGAKKILVYLIAALLAEALFLFLKIRIHFLAADVVLGGGLAGLILPFFSALFIAGSFVIQLDVLNFMLMGFVAGLLGSLVSCFVWHYVKTLVLFIELDMWVKNVS